MSSNENLVGKKVYSEDFGGWEMNGPGPIYGTIIHADENDIQVEWVYASGKVWEETIPNDGYFKEVIQNGNQNNIRIGERT